MPAPDPVILMMLLTIAVTLAIGVHSYREARTERQYFAYGQQLRWFVLGVATFSTVMSGFGFVGGPGLVYSMGSTSLWMTFAAALGIPFSFLLVGQKLRALASADVLTLPDAVHKRFGSQAARCAVAVSILLGILAYLGSQILAATFVLIQVFGADFLPAFWIAVTIVTLYPMIGGIVAGIRTEVFQGALMIVASALVFYFALASGGGMGRITVDVARADQALVGPWGAAPALTALGYLFVFSLGNVGMPHSTSRFLMIADPKQLRYGVLIATGAYMVGSLLWMTVGFAVRARVEAGDLAPLSMPDEAAPLFLGTYAPPWLAGIAFAGLMSAILSTASIFLNVGAATLTRDIPLSLNRPLRRPILWARTWTALLALAAGGLALWSRELVALLGAIGYGLHAAALAPTLVLGLHWRRATAAAAVASATVAIVGSVYFFAAQQLGFAASRGWWVPGHGFPSVGLVMLLSFITFIVVSLVTEPAALETVSRDPSEHAQCRELPPPLVDAASRHSSSAFEHPARRRAELESARQESHWMCPESSGNKKL
jgi:Na+/proline symporter